MPSIWDAISVSSSDSFGSDGAASVNESRSSLNWRASVVRHLELAEARGLLGQLHGGRDLLLVGLGRQNFGVVGDEGGLDPVRARLLHGKLQQLGLRPIDKRPRVIERRRISAPTRSTNK